MAFEIRENDEQEKERKGRKGRKTFNESFSCSKMIDDLQLVFKKIDGNISLNRHEENLWRGFVELGKLKEIEVRF